MENNKLQELRGKLVNLQLQKRLLSLNKDIKKEDFIDINNMIRQVEKEYAKAIITGEENKNGKIH